MVKTSWCFEPLMEGATGKSLERLLRNNQRGFVIYSSSINIAAGSPLGIPTIQGLICIPQMTEGDIGRRTLVYHSRGRTNRQTWFDLLPESEASSFFLRTGETGLRSLPMAANVGKSERCRQTSTIARSSRAICGAVPGLDSARSEEHTSELQSRR